MTTDSLRAASSNGGTTTSHRTDGAVSTQAGEQGAKHTPGPWRPTVQILITGRVDANVYGPNGEDICSVYASDGLDEPTAYPVEANTRLISSAPDLLDALYLAAARLEGIRAWADSDAIKLPDLAHTCRNDLKAIRTVIRKATNS